VLYLNSLNGEIVFDDEGAISENLDVVDHSRPLSKLLEDDFWGTAMSHPDSHKSFRPLTVMTFRLNHLVHGLDVVGYHVVNVILHAVCSWLFMAVCDLILPDATAAGSNLSFAAGILFASHPIHTEAVAGLVGRADTMACMFFMLSFIAYARASKDWETLQAKLCLPASILFAALATFSKETGITVIGVNVLYDVYCTVTKTHAITVPAAKPAGKAKSGEKKGGRRQGQSRQK
jgi:hypothetical protein